MASYLTFERSRRRYVFQMRIPMDLRRHFNRTTVRVALGRIPEDEATRRAQALSKSWTERFNKARKANPRPAQVSPEVVMLTLDASMTARAVATWRMHRLTELKARLDALRSAEDAVWEMEIEQSEALLTARRRVARRAAAEHATAGLRELCARHRVTFDFGPDEQAAFVAAFNAEAVRVAEDWLAVLRGSAQLRDFEPRAHEMLPLVSIFGTPAQELESIRTQRVSAIGKAIRPKTSAKYRRIAHELAGLLGARPVECLTAADVSALMSIWRERDNGPSTIADKMAILVGLLQPVSASAASIVKTALPCTAIRRARRHPLSLAQLQDFRGRVESTSAQPDDARLLDLMILTGARLGELLQLTASNVRWAGTHYVLTFPDHHALKTANAVRELPVLVDGLPELAAWLATRIAQGGRLFPEAQPDVCGHYGNAQSKRLNALLRQITADRRIVLQSTRNTAGRALRRAGVDARLRRRWLGHADLDVHERHYDPGELLTADDLLSAAPVLNALARQLRPCAGPAGTMPRPNAVAAPSLTHDRQPLSP